MTTLDLAHNDVTADGLALLGEACALGALPSLTALNLSHNARIRKLPEAIGHLAELEKLSLAGCVALSGFPESFSKLVCLRELNLTNCHGIDEAALATLPKVVHVIQAS